MKVIVAGGRDFSNYALLKSTLDSVPNISFIVSGGARGADQLGERYAVENEIDILYFPADWDLHGKAAGHMRNAEMAKEADFLIAFWDEESKGTKNIVERMQSLGKHGKVVLY